MLAIDTTRYVMHEGYNAILRNDIALVILPEAVPEQGTVEYAAVYIVSGTCHYR